MTVCDITTLQQIADRKRMGFDVARAFRALDDNLCWGATQREYVPPATPQEQQRASATVRVALIARTAEDKALFDCGKPQARQYVPVMRDLGTFTVVELQRAAGGCKDMARKAINRAVQAGQVAHVGSTCYGQGVAYVYEWRQQ